MGRQCIVFCITFCLTFSSLAAERQYFYRMKKDEFVSQVLYLASLAPIYGRRGYLKLVQNLNAGQVFDINKVKQGQIIYFSQEIVEKAKSQGRILVTAENEIQFKDEIKKESLAVVLPKTVIRQTRAIAQEVLEPAIAKPQAPELPVILQKENNESEQSRLIFSLGSGYSRIDSKISTSGAQAVALSKPLVAVKLSWEQIWSESLESFIDWDYTSISYQDAGHGLLYNSQQSTSMMGFGVHYKLNEKSSFRFEVGTNEEIFIPSYQIGSASLETRPLPYAKLILTLDLAQVRALKLTAGIGGSYLMGGTFSAYDVLPGQEYLLQMKLSQRLKELSFFTEFEYVDLKQNTSIFDQQRKDIRTNIGISIPLFSGDKK